MRGIIYARQSKKEQEENSYSIQGQIDDMTKIAQEHNIELLYEPLTDPATRGYKIHRPGIDKLIREHIDDDGKKIDFVLTVDVDRLGRNESETLYFMGILSEVHINILTKSREYNLEKNPDDFIIAAIDCHNAKKEGIKIGLRTQSGKRARFKDGLWVQGSIPEGYDKKVELSDDGKKKKVRICKNATMVSIITDLFMTFKNKRKYEAAKQLMGVRYQQTFNKELTTSRLKRILQDPVYIGKPRYKIETRCVPELAIINEDLFNEVQEIIGRFKKSDDSKEEKQSAFKEVSKLYGLGFALRTFPEFVPHCICNGHMAVHDGSITKGVWVSRFVCPNHNCNRSKTLPTGKQIDNYKHLNLLSCPYCRETEYFAYCKVQNSDEYIYTCLRCGGSFKSTANPSRYLRKIVTKKDQVSTANAAQQEDTTKKQSQISSLDAFT
jgi:DNA invertase Pin-like site-specific DNA recombinase/uncharacterized protein YbaR (Trm112 family)